MNFKTKLKVINRAISICILLMFFLLAWSSMVLDNGLALVNFNHFGEGWAEVLILGYAFFSQLNFKEILRSK